LLAAFDANEAIQLIDAESPDLVITDLSLRHQRHRNHPSYPRKIRDHPIIVMSAQHPRTEQRRPRRRRKHLAVEASVDSPNCSE